MATFTARSDALLVEELDSGVVIYDKRSHKAHWLDSCSAEVWRACRLPAVPAEIAEATRLDLATCEIALRDLADIGLVRTDAADGVSRRTVLRTAARVGVAGVAAGPIVSAIIPVAAAHASTPGSSAGSGGTGTPQNYVGAYAAATLPHDGSGSYTAAGTAGPSGGSLPQHSTVIVDYQGHTEVIALGIDTPGKAGITFYGFLNNAGDDQAVIYNEAPYTVLYTYQIGTNPPVSGSLPSDPSASSSGRSVSPLILIPPSEQATASLQFTP